MNPLVSQYAPFFLAVIAVGLGVIYSNSRISDIKDLIRSEVNSLRGEMTSMRSDVTAMRVDISAIRTDMAQLDQRVSRIEQRLEHERIVRP